ncbi:MAG: cytidylate kinase-like family protein [Planctomycetes bacterium]|nr:cytidylate kinase-like family protein [Planctomycetota bacterium]
MMEPRDHETELPPESPRHGFQGDRAPPPPTPAVPAGLTIAISRETGARGGTIGRRVGRKLGWQVYDQELLEYLVQESAVQQGLRESLSPEASRWLDQQLQTHLATGRLDDNPSILSLARLSLTLGAQGRVVLIGRGAGFLLPRETTLHVRLVAPFEDRVAYMSQCLRLTLDEARERVRLRDARRSEYLSAYLHQPQGDVYGYDLILNTSSLGEDLSAELVTQAARAKSAQRFGFDGGNALESLPS